MTEEELAALPYSPTPEAQGITSNDYRVQFQQHGERILHWMAFAEAPDNAVGPNGERPESNGILYVANVLPDTVRVLISETERDVFDTDFGLLTKGQTSIACLPDELELARSDRVVLPDRLVLRRYAFEPSGDGRDELPDVLVKDIGRVWAGGQILTASDWTLETEDGLSFIRWMGAVPSDPVLLNYHANPQYVFLDVSDRNPPRGSDQKRLPQRGILTREKRPR